MKSEMTMKNKSNNTLNKQKITTMKKVITILTLITSILLVSCGNENSNQSTTETLVTEKKMEMLFDVPSLVNKNIDEIKEVLGKPSSDTEPTELQLKTGFEEWDKTFEKDGYELLITYNPKTRKVIDFFIATNDPSGKTKKYNDLLQVTNVEENSSIVIVEPVKTIQDPNFFTGIKIMKR